MQNGNTLDPTDAITATHGEIARHVGDRCDLGPIQRRRTVAHCVLIAHYVEDYPDDFTQTKDSTPFWRYDAPTDAPNIDIEALADVIEEVDRDDTDDDSVDSESDSDDGDDDRRMTMTLNLQDETD